MPTKQVRFIHVNFFSRHFYIAKPVWLRIGTPCNFTVLPVSNRGGKIPLRHGAGFPGSLEKARLD